MMAGGLHDLSIPERTSQACERTARRGSVHFATIVRTEVESPLTVYWHFVG
jgi:hypothetical protein